MKTKPFRKRVVKVNLDHVAWPRITIEDIDKLRAAAVRRNVSLNTLHRQIIREWLMWDEEEKLA